MKNAINGFEREKARLTERQEAYKRDTADKKERLVTANEKLTRTKEYSKNIVEEKEKMQKDIKLGEADFLEI